MRKKTGVLLSVLLGCVAAHGVGYRLGVGAYEGTAAFKDLRIVAADGTCVYSNNFASAAAVKDWMPAGRGMWSCRDGRLEQTFGGLGRSAATLSIPRTFRNVTLTVKAQRLSGPEGFIVATGVNRIHGGGEWVVFGGWGNVAHGIEQPPFKRVTVPGRIAADRWYDVKVECGDTRLRAWLDGVLVLEATEKLPVDDSARPASVAPVAGAKARTYSPMIFGHFIEHFDNQVYGGLYWPNHPLSDADGFRTDVIAALRDIKCPIVRWPGGCYVSDYHWTCGVGPNRQPMWNKAWSVEDPNTFGTDEYVKWCRKVGCEPYICTNAGTGTEEEMSDWVEYCNLSVGKWGRLRMANGYRQPHNVLYWSVGNENWGAHEIGAKTVAQWGPLVRESAKMMRGVDRRIKLFAAALPSEQWTLPLLKTAGYLLDYVSVHGYYAHSRTSYLDCMLRTARPEADIRRTIATLEKAGFGGGKIGIAFDEWNLRYWQHPGLGQFKRGCVVNYKARRENDIASTYTMADALFSACFLNTCLRYCDIVKMANFSPIVNTRGALFVHDKGILKRTTYHVFRMYTQLLEPTVIPLTVSCGTLSNGKTGVPVLDAVLSVSTDGTRRVLAVVNKSPDKTVPLDLSAVMAGVRRANLPATVLAGASPNDYNDFGREDRVTPRETTLPVTDGRVALSPHSLSFIRLD